MRDYCEAAAERARSTLATTCDKLAEKGTDTLRIAYDSNFDSCSIETVTAIAAKKDIQVDNELYLSLRDATYDLLPNRWEINEGSIGKLVVDVAKHQVSREHNW